jgi:hypothetical protein
MTALIWEESPLAKNHNRNAFDCGEIELNAYLKRRAPETSKLIATRDHCF